MKRCRALILCVLMVALLVGGCGLRVWQAKRQYALNRQLIAALMKNDGKTALALINAGADPNTRYNPPPAPTFTMLLAHVLRRSSPSDGYRITAFLIACGASWYSGEGQFRSLDSYYPEDAPLVRAMLAHGADCKTKDIHDWSALHFAVFHNHRNTAQLLLEYGVNINEQDSSGRTPLIYAVMNDTSVTHAMAHLLLDHGANDAIEDEWGETALCYAVSYEPNKDIIRLLMAHGADPNHAYENGNSPLKDAQQQHRPDIVDLLRKVAQGHKQRQEEAQGWNRRQARRL